MLQAPTKADQESEAEKKNEREENDWLCGDSTDVCEGARAVRDAVKCNPALCRRIRAARRPSVYGRSDDDFQAVLCVLRNTLESSGFHSL